MSLVNPKRIKDLDLATDISDDDFIPIDSESINTKKILAKSLISEIKLVAAPAANDDFSMFDSGEPPESGCFLAVTSTHLYILSEGDIVWRRSTRSNF